MSERPSSLALRELRTLFSSPRVLVGLCAVCIVLGIAGPFGTDRYMRLVPRMAYWAFVGVASFALGAYVTAFLQARFSGSGNRHSWQLPAVIGLAVGSVVSVLLIAINWVALGAVPNDATYLAQLVANTMVVAAIIAVTMYYLGGPQPATAVNDPLTAPILDRIEIEKRGALVSLSVQDHYVEVVTTRGRSLLLMRLSDAMRETGATDGLQVHRSHWVAQDQVRAATRSGERGMLVMSSGDEIPFSRTYLKAVREAGLLPAGR